MKIAKHISDADMLRSVVLMLRNSEDVNMCNQLSIECCQISYDSVYAQ